MIDVSAAVKALDAARSATVLCHIRPDADTIGSGLALAQVLHRRGVPVWVSFAEPAELPLSLRSLPGNRHVVAPQQVPREVDLLVTVDCGSTGRLGALVDRLAGASTTLVLDHHLSNTRFGSVNVVDDAAVSTASVVAQVLDAWGEPIDRDIAHCLYAGLCTDTGSFRWAGTEGHCLASRLLATGIDGAAISRPLMDTHPFGWLGMLSRVLGSARLLPDACGGRGVVCAFVPRAAAVGLQWDEVESVIDVVRVTAEAAVAVVFKESRENPGTWTVSLRSRESRIGAKDGLDVATVAVELGGGGHRHAAGYTTTGSPDEVLAAVLEGLDAVAGTHSVV